MKIVGVECVACCQDRRSERESACMCACVCVCSREAMCVLE